MAPLTSRETIDMTNIVLDPPLATAPPVKKHLKPSAQDKGKSTAMAKERETLAQRIVVLRAKEKAFKQKELEKEKLLSYYATPDERKAAMEKQIVIEHLVATKADTQCCLAQAVGGKENLLLLSHSSRRYRPLVPRRKSNQIPRPPSPQRRKPRNS